MVVDEVIVVDVVDVDDVKMLVDWIAVADDVDVDIVELIVGVNAARMLKIRINWCDDRTKIVKLKIKCVAPIFLFIYSYLFALS